MEGGARAGALGCQGPHSSCISEERGAPGQSEAARTRGSWGLMPRKATASPGRTATEGGRGDLLAELRPPD